MAKQSYIDKFNNKSEENLQKELSELYRGAYKDALDAVATRTAKFEDIYAQQYKAYQDGKYTDEQWKAWVNTQIRRSEALEKAVADMSQRMTDTNTIAADYINGKAVGVYAENANWEAFEIETGVNGTVRFDLVDEKALRNLASGSNQSEFRAKWKEMGTNPPNDYKWNFERIQTAVQMGLLRGDSIRSMTDRFLQVMGSNEKAAVRNARTAMTSARNAGKLETFERAAEKGLEVIKEWIATSDDRTRDSHSHLDGVRVPWDEDFPNGLSMPGDPKGAPEEVYNCRCTMRRVKSRTEARESKIYNVETGEYDIVRNDVESYNKWKESKLGEKAEISSKDYVDAMNDELKQALYEYTNGHFGHMCDYSQYLIDKDNMQTRLAFYEKEMLPNLEEKEKQQTIEIVNAINEQPVKDSMIYRIERNPTIDPVEGNVVNLGIRSATRDAQFAKKVFEGEMEGFDFEEKHFNGNWMEYRFETSKSLDISGISAYKEQEEELICGVYKIVRVEEVENVKAHWEDTKINVKDIAENVEHFVSKNGKEMVKYSYTYDGTTKQMTDTISSFENRTITESHLVKAQFGRKIIWLRYADE